MVHRVFLHRGHPNRIHLIAVEVKLDILILINTHIDICVLNVHARILGYTQHIRSERAELGSTCMGHIDVFATRQRRRGIIVMQS